VVRKGIFGFPFSRRADETDKEDVIRYLEMKRREVDEIVARYFYTYEAELLNGTIRYGISMEPETLGESFEKARGELKRMGLLPTVVRERDEIVLYVFKAPPAKKRGLKINLIMLILTIASTTWAGTIMWANYKGYDSGLYGPIGALLELFEVLLHPELVLFGALSFALPIMLILGLHETGHYIASKRNNVNATLPFFIPVPPPFILGTFGAFIAIKEPMPSKKALMQIGAAGPIVGFLVAIPVTIVGFLLSTAYPGAPMDAGDSIQYMVLGEPLMYRAIGSFFSLPENNIIHPTAFAGWVGLLITAFNLLPAGQLDGGHIARALLGDNARYFSYASIIALVILSFTTNYHGWIIFAFLILFLGMRHPPPLNDISPLRWKEKLTGIFAISILVVCFIPVPLELIDVEPRIPAMDLSTLDDCLSVDRGGNVTFHLIANNTGSREGNFHFVVSVEYDRLEEVNITSLGMWVVLVEYPSSAGPAENMSLDLEGFTEGRDVGEFDIVMSASSEMPVNLTLTPDPSLPYGSELRLNVSVTEEKHSDAGDHAVLCAKISTIELYTPIRHKNVLAADEVPNIARFFVKLRNIGDINDTVSLSVTCPDRWDAGLNLTESYDMTPGENVTFLLMISPPMLPVMNMSASIILGATSTTNPEVVEELEFRVEILKT